MSGTNPPFDGTGDALREAVLLHRYENTLAVAVARTLATAQDELAQLLTARDPSAVSPGRQAARLEALAREADQVLVGAYAEVQQLTAANLKALGQVAVDLSAEGLSKASGIPVSRLRLPTREQLRSLVINDPVQGAVMGDWWKQQSRGARDRFRVQLRLGLSRGEGLGDLVKRIKGTRTASGLVISQAQAEALVRTAVQEVHSRARFATYAASGVVSRYEYVATLDRRTTALCRSLDGKRFRLDDAKAPRPPMHWQCRSTTIPLVDGVAPIKRQTYGEWLGRQSPAQQDAILGPARGRLFRAGTSLDELVRSDGRPATLAQLRGRSG